MDGLVNLRFLDDRLGQLRGSGLYRKPDDGQLRNETTLRAGELGVVPIDASSNDYLAYARGDVSLGAGASRLIHGTRSEHRQLENLIADWMGEPEALLFSSGFAANLGVVSALAQRGDLIISDALNHASIVDGCRLSRAETVVVSHRDLAAVEAILRHHGRSQQCWVVTESYFSMDGDSPDLPGLRSLCDTHNAPLIVDEAHAVGVFGPEGSGLCRNLGVRPDVTIGTFGKALGAQGAFVACTETTRDWLWNHARSFVYSTALSPRIAAAISENLRRLRKDESARARLERRTQEVRTLLLQSGVPILPTSHGPIIPVILGSPERTLLVASRLSEQGILVQAIRPPTVPDNSSRLRVTLNSELSDEQTMRLSNAIIKACLP
jgi:8-amino-7-oxononanoate synthase